MTENTTNPNNDVSITIPNNDVTIDIPDNIDNSKNYLKKKRFRKRLFEIIEIAEYGDTLSAIYDIFMVIVIIVSLVPLTIKEDYDAFFYLDIVVVCIFITDYLLRLITADYKFHKKSIFSFLLYPFYPWAIVDMLSILPSLTIVYENLKLLRIINLIKTLKIVRAFKTLRYNKSVYIISHVIKQSKKPLIAVCTLSFGYVFISALVIFNVETDDNFNSFFNATYWAVESLTTVGYGDIYPTSNLGRIVAMFCSVFGVAFVALPSGIITAGYMESLDLYLKEKASQTDPIKKDTNHNDNHENIAKSNKI